MYGFNITLTDSFDSAVKRVTEALKTEGFDVRLSRFASRGARKSRAAIRGGPLGGKTVHWTVFSFPPRPWRAPLRGALKRAQFRSRRNCVVVREQPDKKINVGFMDPIAVLKLTDNPAITEIAKEVRGRLERVRERPR